GGSQATTTAAAASVEPDLSAQLNQAAAAELNEPPEQAMPDALAVLDAQAGMLSATDQASDNTVLPIPTLENTGGPEVFLQFDAFSAQANAKSRAAPPNRQIAMVESRQAKVKASSDLYRVQLGPYSSHTEAANAALRIQQHTGAQATVATRD